MSNDPKLLHSGNSRSDFFSICIMLFFSGAFYPFVLARIGDINENQNSLKLQILFSLIYLFCLLISFSDFFNQRKIDYSRHKIALLFGFFLAFSSVWSFDPIVTFRNGIAYVGTLVLAVLLKAKSQGMNHLLYNLLTALRIGCISSLVVAIGSGEYRGKGDVGLSGVFVHKNSFGVAMSLGVILSIYFWRTIKSQHSIVWFILMIVSLYLSNSSTAQLTALLGVLLVFLMAAIEHSVARDRLILISIFTILVIASVLTLLAKNVSVNALAQATTGKDATFTGRTKIWNVASNALDGEHFFLGYGYNAFWFSPESRSLNQYLVGFKNYNTHNGYLEIMLSVGALGLILFLFLLIRNVIESLSGASFVIVFPLTVWFMACNFTESMFITQNTLIPMLVVFLRPDKIEKKRES